MNTLNQTERPPIAELDPASKHILDFIEQNRPAIDQLNQSLDAVTTAYAGFMDGGGTVNFIEITFPSGEYFTGTPASFFTVAPPRVEGLKQLNRYKRKLEEYLDLIANNEYMHELVGSIIADKLAAKDAAVINPDIDEMARLIQEMMRYCLNCTEDFEVKLPGLAGLGDFYQQIDADLDTLASSWLDLRPKITELYLKLGPDYRQATEDFVGSGLDSATDFSRLLGFFGAQGPLDRQGFLNDLYEHEKRDSYIAARSLLLQHNSLPKHQRILAEFILRLEDEGIIDAQNPRVMSIFMEDQEVVKKLDQLLVSSRSEWQEGVIKWFSSYALELHPIFTSDTSLEENIRVHRAGISQMKATLNTPQKRFKRQAQILRQPQPTEAIAESAEAPKEIKPLHNLKVVMGGDWLVSQSFMDPAAIVQTLYAKVFKGLPSELTEDIIKMVTSIQDGSALAASFKLSDRHITRPRQSKTYPILELKINNLTGVPVSTSETYNWRILYSVVDGQCYVLEIHHKDDQDAVLQKFS